MKRPPTSLRIALFHDLPSGGAKRTAHAQARELTDRGNRVEAFLPSSAEEEFFPLAGVAGEVHVLPVPDQPDRERALAGRPSPMELVRWSTLLRESRACQRALARAVDQGGFDLVLVHPSQYTQAPEFLRFAQTPTLYYCHEPLRAAYEPHIVPPLMRTAVRATLGRWDRRNARAADRIAANSAYTAGRIMELYEREARVVRPGVDLEEFRPVRGKRGDYVLSVGAVHPLKGLDLVIRALGRIPEGERPPLLVVSDRHRQAEGDRILALARESGVKVEIRSRTPDEHLRDLYARARVVVCAAHREPFGLVPLEAMACRTPVIAVDEGGFRETVEDEETGILVPRDPEALSEAVRRLQSNPREVERMGSMGRKQAVKKWSWERSTEELLEVMREMVGRAETEGGRNG